MTLCEQKLKMRCAHKSDTAAVCAKLKAVYMRFEVFTAVRMMMFFWVLAPCRLVYRSQRFGEKKTPSSALFLRNVDFYRRV
jgi:hypothetical protein